MRIEISVDLTPEELRRFLGLPDVKAIQDELLEQVRERLRAGGEGLDPLTLMRPFLTPNLRTVEAVQKAFWQALGNAAPGGGRGGGQDQEGGAG